MPGIRVLATIPRLVHHFAGHRLKGVPFSGEWVRAWFGTIAEASMTAG